MRVRREILDFVGLGPLPSEDASAEEIATHQALLERIPTPITLEEARMLLSGFGDDNCYGLAWTLLHVIETAPGEPIEREPSPSENMWIRELWDRARRAAVLS